MKVIYMNEKSILQIFILLFFISSCAIPKSSINTVNKTVHTKQEYRSITNNKNYKNKLHSNMSLIAEWHNSSEKLKVSKKYACETRTINTLETTSFKIHNIIRKKDKSPLPFLSTFSTLIGSPMMLFAFANMNSSEDRYKNAEGNELSFGIGSVLTMVPLMVHLYASFKNGEKEKISQKVSTQSSSWELDPNWLQNNRCKAIPLTNTFFKIKHHCSSVYIDAKSDQQGLVNINFHELINQIDQFCTEEVDKTKIKIILPKIDISRNVDIKDQRLIGMIHRQLKKVHNLNFDHAKDKLLALASRRNLLHDKQISPLLPLKDLSADRSKLARYILNKDLKNKIKLIENKIAKGKLEDVPGMIDSVKKLSQILGVSVKKIPAFDLYLECDILTPEFDSYPSTEYEFQQGISSYQELLNQLKLLKLKPELKYLSKAKSCINSNIRTLKKRINRYKKEIKNLEKKEQMEEWIEDREIWYGEPTYQVFGGLICAQRALKLRYQLPKWSLLELRSVKKRYCKTVVRKSLKIGSRQILNNILLGYCESIFPEYCNAITINDTVRFHVSIKECMRAFKTVCR